MLRSQIIVGAKLSAIFLEKRLDKLNTVHEANWILSIV